jgi:hypothetical protein
MNGGGDFTRCDWGCCCRRSARGHDRWPWGKQKGQQRAVAEKRANGMARSPHAEFGNRAAGNAGMNRVAAGKKTTYCAGGVVLEGVRTRSDGFLKCIGGPAGRLLFLGVHCTALLFAAGGRGWPSSRSGSSGDGPGAATQRRAQLSNQGSADCTPKIRFGAHFRASDGSQGSSPPRRCVFAPKSHPSGWAKQRRGLFLLRCLGTMRSVAVGDEEVNWTTGPGRLKTAVVCRAKASRVEFSSGFKGNGNRGTTIDSPSLPASRFSLHPTEPGPGVSRDQEESQNCERMPTSGRAGKGRERSVAEPNEGQDELISL